MLERVPGMTSNLNRYSETYHEARAHRNAPWQLFELLTREADNFHIFQRHIL